MQTRLRVLIPASSLLFLIHCSASVLYVDLTCTNPTPPFTNWITAAANIQDAVDAALPGDEVVVTNGVYQTGGRLVSGSATTNRVVVDKAITLRSVNGPTATVIQGQQAPGGGSGVGAVRCAYLTNGAVLSGFTLTNGASSDLGGGVSCGSWGYGLVTNCTLTGNLAKNGGGGACYGVLQDCVLNNNLASSGSGGGVFDSRLNHCTLWSNLAVNGGAAYYSGSRPSDTNFPGLDNCTLSGNSATFGGGTYNGKLSNCVLTCNFASKNGGGAYFASPSGALTNCTLAFNSAASGGGASAVAGTLFNCYVASNSAGIGGGAVGLSSPSGIINCTFNGNWATNTGGGVAGSWADHSVLTNNWAGSGGGASGATLYYCLVADNCAATNGGGTSTGALYNCVLTGNRASYGGGAYGSTIAHSTLVGNTATNDGGGVVQGRSFSNIIYYNTSLGTAPNYSGDYTYFSDCCTPDPAAPSSITNEPLFMDLAGGNLRLQTNSPCINNGNNDYATPADMDGNARVVGGTVDVGAYECQTPALLNYYLWLQGYGLSTAASAIYADSEGDGMNNWQEWVCGTNPTNALSVLVMLPAAGDGGSGVTLSWQSVSGKTYYLLRGTGLGSPGTFSAIQSNIAGQASTTSCVDTTATNAGPYFYRVGIQ